jgi:tetratricopeptide (TPR) repeat protein
MPGDAGLHFNRGYVLEQGGCPAEAVAAFGEAVRLNPAFDLAWYGLGMAQARLGEHAEAAAAFARAAELQPMNGEAFYQWAMACHHAHQPDQVTEIAKRLAGFEPKRALKLIKDAERPDLRHLVPAEVREFFETHRQRNPASFFEGCPEPSKKEPANAAGSTRGFPPSSS